MINERYVLFQIQLRNESILYTVYDTIKAKRTIKLHDIASLENENVSCDIPTNMFRGIRLELGFRRLFSSDYYTAVAVGYSFEELKFQMPWLFI